MTTNEAQEMFKKLENDLAQLKESHPQEYLELLKILNRGMNGIASDLEKAVGG